MNNTSKSINGVTFKWKKITSDESGVFFLYMYCDQYQFFFLILHFTFIEVKKKGTISYPAKNTLTFCIQSIVEIKQQQKKSFYDVVVAQSLPKTDHTVLSR